MIKVENLSKEFKISKKYPGFKGALRSFFSTEYTIKIDSGKKIYDGELEGVKEQFGYLTTIEIQLKDKSNIEKINFARFKDDDFKLNMKESKINITFNKNNISSADIIGEVMKKSKVIDFNIKETSIEDIVKKMYKNEVWKWIG